MHLFDHHLGAPFIGLPRGADFSTRLLNPLTIPLFFGSENPIDLLDSTIEILLMPRSSQSAPDASVRRISSYRAEVFYDEAPNSLTGMFSLGVIAGGRTAEAPIFVTVTRKLL